MNESGHLFLWLILQVLIEAGLIAGGDMTPEAALSKLSYVLAKKELALEAKKKAGGTFNTFFSIMWKLLK